MKNERLDELEKQSADAVEALPATLVVGAGGVLMRMSGQNLVVADPVQLVNAVARSRQLLTEIHDTLHKEPRITRGGKPKNQNADADADAPE